ncbi:hypothetical protein B0T25DRAFT_254750 [Lasiosphaeria hispida]|uniref:Uncharacterized protein n=1 Tax=Lasiosphaeria hispida TaxID=260671 RepID=A0AAJ0HFR6_9PEZI|nr:hypothetical protein B0T25DRAFT_254750 [Lasiosphaeria hispida]
MGNSFPARSVNLPHNSRNIAGPQPGSKRKSPATDGDGDGRPAKRQRASSQAQSRLPPDFRQWQDQSLEAITNDAAAISDEAEIRAIAGTDTAAASANDEAKLGILAVDWMGVKYVGQPRGTPITPPPWFQRDRVFHPQRPIAWIMNWGLQKIPRPRTMTDDLIENMSPEKRAEYIWDKHGVDLGEEEELDEGEDEQEEDDQGEDGEEEEDDDDEYIGQDEYSEEDEYIQEDEFVDGDECTEEDEEEYNAKP